MVPSLTWNHLSVLHGTISHSYMVPSLTLTWYHLSLLLCSLSHSLCQYIFPLLRGTLCCFMLYTFPLICLVCRYTFPLIYCALFHAKCCPTYVVHFSTLPSHTWIHCTLFYLRCTLSHSYMCSFSLDTMHLHTKKYCNK